jgi:hypothetical protein
MPELHNEPLTFEKVWAMFQETRERQEETARQMKETYRKIGELGNRFGEIAEYMVAPGIMDKFNAIGFNFTRVSRNHEIKDPQTKKSLTEADIILENGDIVIVVEVKSKLQNEDVDDHLKRMNILRHLADSKGDSRKYCGAIAGVIVADATRNYALKAGFYVIEQSGDAMKLDIPEGFVPREW